MSEFHATKTPGIRYKQTSTGRTYYITFKDGDGVRRTEAVKGVDYEGAKARLGEINGKRVKGQVPPPKVTETYKGYAERVLRSRHARELIGDETLDLYSQRLRDHVVPVIGGKKLKDVTKHDILAVVDKAREAGLSGWTIHSIICVMSVVAKEAVWEFEIPNPVADLKAEHRPRKTGSATKMHLFARDEIVRLIKTGFEHGRTVRAGMHNGVFKTKVVEGRTVGCLLALAIYTGLRQSELLGLRWGDLDLAGDIPKVTARGQLRRGGKGWKGQLKAKNPGIERTVEFPRHVAKLLTVWKVASKHSGDGDYIFTNPETGQPYQQAWARKVFVEARDDAGIQTDVEAGDRCTFHDMRDTFASILIAGGANIVEVQQALGHEKASTTLDHYAHLWDAQGRPGKLRDILEAASA